MRAVGLRLSPMISARHRRLLQPDLAMTAKESYDIPGVIRRVVSKRPLCTKRAISETSAMNASSWELHMNKIVLIGNLTRDPELRATPNGVSVCSFNIAVNRRFNNADGEKVADFFRINAWRQLGENCGRYLAKGKKVAVIGELQARTYEAADGTTRMSLDVSADEIEFLTPRGDAAPASAPAPAASQQAQYSPSDFNDIQNDDIPF